MRGADTAPCICDALRDKTRALRTRGQSRSGTETLRAERDPV